MVDGEQGRGRRQIVIVDGVIDLTSILHEIIDAPGATAEFKSDITLLKNDPGRKQGHVGGIEVAIVDGHEVIPNIIQQHVVQNQRHVRRDNALRRCAVVIVICPT